MMAARPGLSKSELEIAQIVWKLGSARVRDVVAALPADRDVDFWTVQTYLRRLKAKGYLRTRREGRADVYLPTVGATTVVRSLVKDLVDRLFGGDALPLVQHLIDDRGLSASEIDELQAKLVQMKKRGKS
jgi:BlaI family penicillinase repressor